MKSFDISGLDLDSLRRVLHASFPDAEFEIADGTLRFAGGESPQEAELLSLFSSLRVAEKHMPKSHSQDVNQRANRRETNKVDPVDVQRLLEGAGDVVWIGDGLAVLSGAFLEVKRALEGYWYSYAIKDLSAKEMENPSLWSVETAKLANYLEDFPHESAIVYGLRKSSNTFREFTKKLRIEGLSSALLDSDETKDSIEPIAICQPAVCTSCYHALGISKASQNQLYTTYNRVFRNEGKRRIQRLLSFSVRDIIAVGSAEFVRDNRDMFLEKARDFINECLLDAEIVRATDPFFLDSSNKIFFQKIGDLKHELQAWSQYEGEAVAVGSINLHLDTFGKRFSLTSGQQHLHSACFGIGFERLTYVLFCQNGIDLKNWSYQLRATIGL
jgi:hypothetical protein